MGKRDQGLLEALLTRVARRAGSGEPPVLLSDQTPGYEEAIVEVFGGPAYRGLGRPLTKKRVTP